MDHIEQIPGGAAESESELAEMYAAYEALDEAEYAQFNVEMDARDAAAEG